MSVRHRNRILAGVSAITLTLGATPAFAQDDSAEAAAEGEETRAPEIIVTAQFREQLLQDIPIAITAPPSVLRLTRSARHGRAGPSRFCARLSKLSV